MSQLMLVNPRRRRRTTAKRKTPAKSRARRALSSVSRRVSTVRRRYRRNPIKMTGIMGQFEGGAIGAAGALGVDFLMTKLPLPASLTAGSMAPVAKGLVGIGLGMAVSKFGKKRKLGEQLAGGAVTVALYEFGKTTIGPHIGLSGNDGLLGYDDGLLGYDDFNDGVGWINPSAVSSWDDSGMNGYDDFQ